MILFSYLLSTHENLSCKPHVIVAALSMRIQNQHFTSMRIRIQGFDDKKFKILQLKKMNVIVFLKIAIYSSLGLHKGRSSYRRNLQPSKDNIHHFKTSHLFFFYFCGSCFPPWIRTQRTKIKCNSMRSGSPTLGCGVGSRERMNADKYEPYSCVY
jgi:hypothetical protein